MEVKYHSGFDKDLEEITQPYVKKAVLKVIERAKSARHLGEIPRCEKLTGYRNAYRIRIGEFRIGVFFRGKYYPVCKSLQSKRYLQNISMIFLSVNLIDTNHVHFLSTELL